MKGSEVTADGSESSAGRSGGGEVLVDSLGHCRWLTDRLRISGLKMKTSHAFFGVVKAGPMSGIR